MNFTRLLTTVVPLHYDITIQPDLKELVFQGHEKITIKVRCEARFLLFLLVSEFIDQN